MNTVGIQLRISDLLFAVQKRWKIIVSLTLMGLVFGLLLSGMNYVQSAVEEYQIEGSFIIAAVDSQGRYSSNSSAPSKNDIALATEMYDTVYYLLRSDRLLSQIINDEQLLGVSASDIRNRLTISQYSDTNIITLSVSWDLGDEGLLLWEDIISTANSLLSQLVQVGRLRIFNEPVVTLINSRTANIKTWMILPVLGFAAGMGYAVIELMMRPTLINVKDVETVFGLETIGIIPHDSAFFKERSSILVSDEKASSDVAQSFSAAAYILRNRIGSKDRCHCFYITSATGQEGRTSVAASLAIELSDMEKHTLLIDFDYKNPMLGSLFLNNIDYNRSLNALYQGEITISDAITPMTGYLDLLPMVMEHNLIYLDSAIVEMISQLKERYDFIIIDAPPVGKESETLSLNQVANAVLFVVRYDMASIPEIHAALEKLDKSGTRVLGCIVNAVQTSRNVLMGVGKKETEKKALPAAKKKTSGTSNNKKKKKKKKKPLAAEKSQVEKQEDNKENDVALLALINKQKVMEAEGDAEGMDMDLPPSMRKTQAHTGAPAAQDTQETPFTPTAPGPEDWPLPPVSAPTEPEQAPKADSLPQPEIVNPKDWPQPPVSAPAESEQTAQAEPLPEPEIVNPEDLPLLPVSAPAESEEAPKAEPLPEPEIVSPEDWPLSPAGEETNLSLSGQASAEQPVPPEAPEPITPVPPLPERPQKKRGLFSFLFKEPAKPTKTGKAEKPAKAENPPKAGKSAKTEKTAKVEKPIKAEKTKVQKPAKPEKSKAAPDKKKAAAETKAKAQPVKKKKAGGGFWGLGIEKTPKNPPPLKEPMPEATVIKTGRNVFDDLIDDAASVEPYIKSDAEVTEELVRMGLDGSWTSSPDAAKPQVSHEKSGKRNPFDDL